MMKFKCPSCGNPFRVPESAAGRKGNCKKCGQTVKIPDLEKEAIRVAEVYSKPENSHEAESQASGIIFVVSFCLIGIVLFGFIINSFINHDNKTTGSSDNYSSDSVITPVNTSRPDTRSSSAGENASPKTDLASVTQSLKSYLNECNSRIDSIKSNYQESLVRITPSGEIDVKRSDSALNPYYGVLTVEVDSTNSMSRYHLYRYEFTIKPSFDGGWDFVGCYGGPAKGKHSAWSLRDLAYQGQGKIAMEWLLGREKSRELLRTAL